MKTMSSALCTLSLGAFFCLYTNQASAQSTRAGSTFEIGLGVGATEVFSAADVTTVRPGIAPAAVMIGGFLNPKVALGLRYAMVNNTFESIGYGNHMVGLEMQYWFSDDFLLSGNLAFVSQAFNNDYPGSAGAGASLKASFLPFVRTDSHNLRLAFELMGALSPGHIFAASGPLLEFSPCPPAVPSSPRQYALT